MPKTMFLKKVDAALGGGVARLCRLVPPRRETGEAPAKALVIRPGGIGDAVLLIPALAALKERFPALEITVLAEKRNGAVFGMSPALHRLLLYDRPGDLWQALRGGYDLVIDTEQWHRLSAVVARLMRAPLCIGFAGNERSRLFSRQIPYSQESYEADSFFDLLGPLGIAPPAALEPPFLSVPARAAGRAAELLAPAFPKRYAVLFPGASIPQRRWGAGRFREVAERLVGEGIAVVVVGGKDDVGDGEAIVAGCGGVNLAGRTSLAETAALIEGAALLLSGDSGVLHIAVGLGVPTVSLFGPGIQAKWGPRGEGHLVLNRRLPCSPCTRFGTTPPCPIGAKCMADIGVDEVFAGMKSILQLRNSA